MKKYIVAMMLSIGLCANVFAIDGYLWNCDQFPQNAPGLIMISGGAGSRHIMDTSGQYGEEGYANPLFDANDNHYYFVNATVGSYGFYHDTKPEAWHNADSTIEIRLNIDAYCDSKTDVLGLLIMGNGKVYGFRWGRASATNNIAQIRSCESSSKLVNFDHFQHFVTYRVLYYATAGYAELYYYDQGEMKFLLRSDGAAYTSIDMLRVGDYTSTMAGRWLIDYQYWTNSGIYKTDPLFCGSAEYTFKAADMNQDCKINLQDIAVLGSDWLKCTRPDSSACDAYWQSLSL